MPTETLAIFGVRPKVSFSVVLSGDNVDRFVLGFFVGLVRALAAAAEGGRCHCPAALRLQSPGAPPEGADSRLIVWEFSTVRSGTGLGSFFTSTLRLFS